MVLLALEPIVQSIIMSKIMSINADPRHDANINLKNCFIQINFFQRYKFFHYICIL